MKNKNSDENQGRFKTRYVLICIVLLLGGCAGKGVNLRIPSEAPPDAVPVLGRLSLTSDLPMGNQYSFAEVLVGSEVDPEFKAYFQLKTTDDGWFRWNLRPGRYVIQTVTWKSSTPGGWTTTAKNLAFNRRIWATFSVPESAPAVYIGTLAFNPSSKDLFIHEAQVVDEFHILPSTFAKEIVGVNPIQQLMEWRAPR